MGRSETEWAALREIIGGIANGTECGTIRLPLSKPYDMGKSSTSTEDKESKKSDVVSAEKVKQEGKPAEKVKQEGKPIGKVKPKDKSDGTTSVKKKGKASFLTKRDDFEGF